MARASRVDKMRMMRRSLRYCQYFHPRFSRANDDFFLAAHAVIKYWCQGLNLPCWWYLFVIHMTSSLTTTSSTSIESADQRQL